MSTTEQRSYTAIWRIDVEAGDPAEGAQKAADLMRGPRTDVDEFEVYDLAARTATAVDLVTGDQRDIPYGPRVDVVVDHDYTGTDVTVFVEGRHADPEDLRGPAAWHVIDPGGDDDNPDHAWYRANVENRPEVPAPVREFINHLAMGYHDCGSAEDCGAADPEGVVVLTAEAAA